MRSIGYCCRYVWKTSPKYIVLLVLVSVLTAAFNVINLLILRLITESLAANNTYSFCIALLILVMVSILIAAINGSVNYLIEPVLKNKVIEHIQGDNMMPLVLKRPGDVVMKKRIFEVLFIIYVIFLIWAILFKFNISYENIRHVREINLVPFHYENVPQGDIPALEAFMNGIIFIPAGLLLPQTMKRKTIIAVCAMLCISFILESLQYMLSIGSFDVTDLITNTAGGTLGIFLSKKLNNLYTRRKGQDE